MIIRLFALLAAMCFATTAKAENAWSTPASACAPDAAAIKFDRHITSFGVVQYAPNSVAIIFLACQMAPFSSATQAWNLKLVYVDSTGTNPSAYAKATLFRQAIGGTGAIVASVSSNSSSATGLNTVSSPTFKHVFNFETGIYWVRLELDRTSTSERVIIHAVYLDGV